MYRPISLSILLFCGFLLSCHSHLDETGPIITIQSPASLTDFELGDTLHLEADITDESVLTSVEVLLYDHQGAVVSSIYRNTTNGKHFVLKYDPVMQDPYLEGLDYDLCFRASDGTNISSVYRRVRIHVPKKEMCGLMVLTKKGEGFSVFRLPVDSSFVKVMDINHPWQHSTLESRYKMLWVCQKGNLGIHSYQIFDGKEGLSIEPESVSFNPGFAKVDFSGNLLWAFSNNPCQLQAYTHGGVLKYGSNTQTTSLPVCMAHSANRAAACFHDKFNGQYMAGIFFYPGGLLELSRYLEFVPVEMIAMSDIMWYIAGNQSGKAVVYQFDSQQNKLTHFKDFNDDTLTDIKKLITGDLVIARAKGVTMYVFSNNLSVELSLMPVNAKLAVDEVNGEIFAFAGKKLMVFDPQTAALIHTYSLADSILAVHPYYNK